MSNCTQCEATKATPDHSICETCYIENLSDIICPFCNATNDLRKITPDADDQIRYQCQNCQGYDLVNPEIFDEIN